MIKSTVCFLIILSCGVANAADSDNYSLPQAYSNYNNNWDSFSNMRWTMNMTMPPQAPQKNFQALNSYLAPSYLMRQPSLPDPNYNMQLNRQQASMTVMTREQYFKYTQQLNNIERDNDLKQRQIVTEQGMVDVVRNLAQITSYTDNPSP